MFHLLHMVRVFVVYWSHGTPIKSNLRFELKIRHWGARRPLKRRLHQSKFIFSELVVKKLSTSDSCQKGLIVLDREVLKF